MMVAAVAAGHAEPRPHWPQQGQLAGTTTVSVAPYLVRSYPSPFSAGSSWWATTR